MDGFYLRTRPKERFFSARGEAKSPLPPGSGEVDAFEQQHQLRGLELDAAGRRRQGSETLPARAACTRGRSRCGPRTGSSPGRPGGCETRRGAPRAAPRPGSSPSPPARRTSAAGPPCRSLRRSGPPAAGSARVVLLDHRQQPRQRLRLEVRRHSQAASRPAARARRRRRPARQPAERQAPRSAPGRRPGATAPDPRAGRRPQPAADPARPSFHFHQRKRRHRHPALPTERLLRQPALPPLVHQPPPPAVSLRRLDSLPRHGSPPGADLVEPARPAEGGLAGRLL